jgi:hypothetical protein
MTYEKLITIMGGKQTVQRCQAKSEASGDQCKRPSRNGGNVCKWHKAPEPVLIVRNLLEKSESHGRWMHIVQSLISMQTKHAFS